MRRRRTIGLAALAAAAALVLAACGGSSGSGSGSGSSSIAAGFNAAVTTGGQPVLAQGRDASPSATAARPDSTDPGNTYYAYMWNFVRLYTMPLMTYKSCPGSCGLQVVPDLATGPGWSATTG